MQEPGREEKIKRHCSKQERRKIIRHIIKNALLSAISIILYLWARKAVREIRGYEATGGEVTILALPLLWYAVDYMTRDFLGMIRKNRQTPPIGGNTRRNHYDRNNRKSRQR